MKRFTLVALSATTIMAQAPATSATVAAPARAAAPMASYTTSVASSAPLAPVSTRLLQTHPGAPLSIDDVLLVPSASARQKAVAFEWSDSANAQAYVLWDKYFAAAQFTGATSGSSDAQTIASFGLMTSAYGAGLSIATRDTTTENAAASKTTTTRALTQLKVFGSATLPDNLDVYASVQRLLVEDYTVIDDGDNSAKQAPRHERFLLQVGARKYPAADVQGLAWNLYATEGFDYHRVAGSKNNVTLISNLDGQLGYVLLAEGISLLPGLDAYLHYSNGPRNPDYSLVGGVSPYAAILLPLFQHWTLKGGARYVFEQSLVDNQQGDPSVFNDHQLIEGTSGNFGLRYDHKRWALEAQIGNGLITQGPAVISGNSGYDLFASLALTVDLK